MNLRPVGGILTLLAILLIAASCGGYSSPENGLATIEGAGTNSANNDAGAISSVSRTESESESRTKYEPLAYPAVLPNPSQVVKLPIMMFHHIGDPPAGADEIRIGLTLPAAEFDAQMSYLKQAGYQPVTQTQLFKSIFEGVPLPPKPVLLTFDDGYADNYQLAVPILQKYGFTATFNIITGMVGNPDYMTWDQVVELDRQGLEIGSHTASHPDLTLLSAADLNLELTGSAESLKSHLGHPVYWLCYPAGKYDEDVLKYARAAGYLLAVTTKPGENQSSDEPLALLRYRVRSDTTVEEFQELVR